MKGIDYDFVFDESAKKVSCQVGGCTGIKTSPWDAFCDEHTFVWKILNPYAGFQLGQNIRLQVVLKSSIQKQLTKNATHG